MAKARKAVPCEVNPTTCRLLENHNGSCVFSRCVQMAEADISFWRVILSHEDGTVLTAFDLVDEPDDEQLRAAATFLYDRGRFPGVLRAKLPLLVGAT